VARLERSRESDGALAGGETEKRRKERARPAVSRLRTDQRKQNTVTRCARNSRKNGSEERRAEEKSRRRRSASAEKNQTLAHGNQSDKRRRGAISGSGNPSVLFTDWKLGRALTQEWSKNQKSTPNQNQIQREQTKREPNFRFLHNKIQPATRCKLEIFHWNPN
jgi:hypothetical protein